MIATYSGKRVLDLAVALFTLFVLSPVISIVALLVLLFHGRPILFVQQRPGLHGQPFNMLKFRSMTDARDNAGALLSAELRVTRFGKFIRLMSLDELPELFNVVRGKMSIVGPRPLLMQYLPLYTAEQMHRHDAMPGITGWAQVNGRNNMTWDQKFALDIWYVDNIAFKLDLLIIWRTIVSLIHIQNVNKDGFEGMDVFKGGSGGG